MLFKFSHSHGWPGRVAWVSDDFVSGIAMPFKNHINKFGRLILYNHSEIF